MPFISVQQASKNWQLSERTVREYCQNGRIPGAIIRSGIWQIPASAHKPERKNPKDTRPTLKEALRRENRERIPGGIYHKVQIELTYNSNHIEGSRLTHDQTRYIFETNTVAPGAFPSVNANDVIETANHFRCVDYIIDNANRKPSENLIKKLHFILKNGTSASREDWFAVGAYKKFPNEVGGLITTAPADVSAEMKKLLNWYNHKTTLRFDDLLEFHHRFEAIHPFQDGNGRVGRLILFKECLRLNIIPFIIDENLKLFYYRGLSEWGRERGFLRETCWAAQDQFKQWLDYFEIKY